MSSAEKTEAALEDKGSYLYFEGPFLSKKISEPCPFKAVARIS